MRLQVKSPYLASVVVLAGLVLQSGCSDRCDRNTDKAYCQGNDLVSCELNGNDFMGTPDTWSVSSCSEWDATCFDTGNGALCVLPDPAGACAGIDYDGVCESETSKVWCVEGYATLRSACLSCEQGWCTGGFYSACDSSEDCAPGYVCRPEGCAKP